MKDGYVLRVYTFNVLYCCFFGTNSFYNRGFSIKELVKNPQENRSAFTVLAELSLLGTGFFLLYAGFRIFLGLFEN
jgi:hypothetical protein